MERFPDIEIYLAVADVDAITQWLRQALDDDALTLNRAGKGIWRGRTAGAERGIGIMLVERAADGYASLWFDCDATPWPRDADCARDAARELGCEARCSLGGWQPGDDPDRFWQVTPDGRESTIEWPDSGR
ncbi:MAG: hypothetical protein CMN25_07305 [Salinicola sp.]|uniref:hypothetical protein n=1 Tax=Salinicola sp. TaxID=1978524 RepID=UPI000C916514|nr:hypothetical protein [Salinicola sp.]MAM57124.1 hypothetical protein [Salinicola sp.]NRB57241.1 hypothetical protein [Salinicola sp.]|tara:strand:- start:909 stop:1301 length:393 start_codon:yes stop_codon:yes gene_type:complete